MFGRAAVLVLPLLLVFAIMRSRRSRRPLDLNPSPHGILLAGYRKAILWRWAGLGLGLVAAAVTAKVGSLGRGLMLAPTVFGLAVIAGVVAGELATIPRRQGVRTAALETRAVRKYLPSLLGGMVLASTVGLGVLLITTTQMGSADDMGRAGRSLVALCASTLQAQAADGSVPISSGGGPWPGVFYSLPLGIAVVVGLLGAAMALRTVVLRPWSGSDPELVAADELLRRRSAEAVVAATGVMVAASLLGIALTAGSVLLNPSNCAPQTWTILGIVLLVVAALMMFLAVWCLALLLSGPRIGRLQSGERDAAGETVSR